MDVLEDREVVNILAYRLLLLLLLDYIDGRDTEGSKKCILRARGGKARAKMKGKKSLAMNYY